MQTCSKCKKQHRRMGQRYCLDCYAAYMGANRPKHSDLSAEQKKRQTAGHAQKHSHLLVHEQDNIKSRKGESA